MSLDRITTGKEASLSPRCALSLPEPERKAPVQSRRAGGDTSQPEVEKEQRHELAAVCENPSEGSIRGRDRQARPYATSMKPAWKIVLHQKHFPQKKYNSAMHKKNRIVFKTQCHHPVIDLREERSFCWPVAEKMRPSDVRQEEKGAARARVRKTSRSRSCDKLAESLRS